MASATRSVFSRARSLAMLLAQSDEELLGQFSGLGWEDWAIAAGTFVVGLIIARIIGSFVKRAVDKTPASEFVGVVLSRIVVGIIGFLGFYFALQSLGVPLGPLVGALGIAGLALAFAFQDILENVIAGLLMLMRRPIGIGDEVELGITCALVPTDLPGVTIGRRHSPSGAAFMNGPTQGHEVFVPLDWVIGSPSTRVSRSMVSASSPT